MSAIGEVRLQILFGDGYPHLGRLPRITLSHCMQIHELPADGAEALVAAAREAAREALDAMEEGALCMLMPCGHVTSSSATRRSLLNCMHVSDGESEMHCVLRWYR